jgi:thymidylate kinase
MLIFVEGPDGSGKTTLCKELIKAGAADILVTVPRGAKNQNEFYEWIRHIKHRVVFDRCFISDVAYRLWDNCKPDDMTLEDMLYVLHHGNSCIIFCDTDTAFDDAQSRGESFITNRKNHDIISNNYKTLQMMLRKFTKVPIMVYDRKFSDVSDVIKFIEKGGN